VDLQAAEERAAGQDLPVDHRCAAAADAGLPLIEQSPDLLVVGGGPAGLAAAVEAVAAGLSVTLVDERPTLGGQIFKQPGPGFRVTDPGGLGADFRRGRSLIDAAERSGARLLPRTSAVAITGTSVVLLEEGGRARTVEARRVLIAPGAHDRPVAFPGWTLPGVITAGGAQTLVKTQRVLPGRRIVFAGSGPLALAFPAQLRGYGANVTLVLEAGPSPGPRDVVRLLRAARGNVALLRDALAYRSALLRARVPLRYRRIVVRAEGAGRVEAVVHAAADRDWRPVPGTEERAQADALCLGYGFFPAVELLRLAGCDFAYDEDLGGPVVAVDEWRRTTVPGVLAAGDGTGVAGSYVAVDQGRLAALGAALDLGALMPAGAERRAEPIRRRLAEKERFRRSLRRLHRVGPGIYELASPDTVVCRCEELTAGALDTAVAATADLDVVKTLTRVTMGLCQGRNCQRHVLAAIARRHGGTVGGVRGSTPRAPVRPVPIGAIADASIPDGKFFAGDA
jgi:NADPH-dependent 2,4-dienoyl-CoA reductase/sulfur reductase-like enzyme